MIVRFVNTGCAHKQATHAHGTHACYVLDKCRCSLCRPANAMYERDRRRRRAYAAFGLDEYAAFVDAGPAVAHIRVLQEAGLGWKQVAYRAGLSASNVYPLLYGRPDRRHGAPRVSCRLATARAILAVAIPSVIDLRPGHIVDVTPTRNRIRALSRIGYSNIHVARLVSLDPQRIYHATDPDATTTSVSTHVAIAQLFTAYWARPYQPGTGPERTATSRAMKRALAQGWPAPIDLDEDGFIDVLEMDTSDLEGVAA